MYSSDDPEARRRSKIEIDDLVRTLRSYGVLTRHDLCECSHGSHWREFRFEAALKNGVREGRIRELTDGLYELGEREQDA